MTLNNTICSFELVTPADISIKIKSIINKIEMHCLEVTIITLSISN